MLGYLIRALLSGFLLFIPLESFAENATQFGRELSNKILSGRITTNLNGELLEKLFMELAAQGAFRAPVRLNSEYADDALNIYVVDFAAPEARFSGLGRRTGALVRGARNNALAIPPNVLLFDYDFIAALVMNAFNEHTGYAQAIDAVRREDNVDQAEVWGVLLDYYRLRNIRNARIGEHSEATPRILASPLLATADENDVIDVLAFALAPVFFHELGHLWSIQPADAAAFDIVDGLRRVFLGSPEKTFAEEALADVYALDHMNRFLEHNAHNRHWGLYYQSVMATVKYMRDKVQDGVFSEFRGLSAEDIFLTFLHRDCRAEPLTASLEFSSSQKLALAYWSPFPLLTAEEFDSVRETVLTGIGTHAHHFTRGGQILEGLEGAAELGNPNMLGASLRLLEAAEKSDPAVLDEYSMWSGRSDIGVHLDQVGAALRLEFEPAVNCPPQRCYVGTFEDGGPGFVEATGPIGSLQSLRVVVPLLEGEVDDGQARVSPRGSLILRNFLEVIRDAPSASELKASFIDEFINSVSACGAASALETSRGIFVLATTINREGWVSVEADNPEREN